MDTMSRSELANLIKCNIVGSRRVLNMLHTRAKRLEARAAEQWEVAHTEQWEAYMEVIKHTHTKIIDRCNKLARLRHRAKTFMELGGKK